LVLNANGSFSYAPAANYNGPDSFSFEANDGSADSNVATVAITVIPVNDAPVVVSGGYTTNEDSTGRAGWRGGVTGSSGADGVARSAVLVSGPSHGTLTLNADGRFSYTPAANYNGPDSFTFKANDVSADSNVATVAITVIPVNDAPVVVSGGYTTNED